MKKYLRIIFWSLSTAIVLSILLLLTCNWLVVNNAKGKTYDDADSMPASDVGLLLGTTPQTRIGGGRNLFFKYRIDAAEELYKAGKIKCILISGDENSLDGVNEPECMKDTLLARGIPDYHIFLDGRGFRTINSVVRAGNRYKGREFTIISQEFHNERALYLAEHLGLDIKGVRAFNAKSPHTTMSMITYVREYFARVKMFLDIVVGEDPKGREPWEIKSAMPEIDYDDPAFGRGLNTIVAHDEQDTIVGNFTGRGIDTLYVECVPNPEAESITDMYLSTYKRIPKVELNSCSEAYPKLVNECDLDGNGTCEVGSLT